MPIMSDLEKTIQTSTSPQSEKPEGEPRASIWKTVRWFLLGLIIVILAAAGIGYTAGLRNKDQNRSETVEQVAHEQFTLALEDLNEGRYAIAKQRLEYIISIDPTYPNIAETLAQALVELNAPTATPVVVSQATATPNLAPVEDLFTQIEAAVQAEDWDQVIDTTLVLRSKNPEYEAIAVDGYMFTALRNRGVNRISNDGLLEEGIYDLSRAEQFGPLDSEARNWRDWAELYLLANSYYGIDWTQAYNYFSQLYIIAPYLKNDTYIKYSVSASEYGMLRWYDNDPCGAVDAFKQSLTALDDPELHPTATRAAVACRTATAKPPEPTEAPQDTPTPDGGGETEPTPE